jgi:hypothetical protein
MKQRKTTKRTSQQPAVTRADEVAAANDLADHIAAIMRHPLTPPKLRDGLTEALDALDRPGDIYNESDYLAVVLSLHMRLQSEGQ